MVASVGRRAAGWSASRPVAAASMPVPSSAAQPPTSEAHPPDEAPSATGRHVGHQYIADRDHHGEGDRRAAEEIDHPGDRADGDHGQHRLLGPGGGEQHHQRGGGDEEPPPVALRKLRDRPGAEQDDQLGHRVGRDHRLEDPPRVRDGVLRARADVAEVHLEGACRPPEQGRHGEARPRSPRARGPRSAATAHRRPATRARPMSTHASSARAQQDEQAGHRGPACRPGVRRSPSAGSGSRPTPRTARRGWPP